MITHPFDPSKFASSMNRYKSRLFSHLDQLSCTSFSLNNEYYEVNGKEEMLCREDEISDHEHFHDFDD